MATRSVISVPLDNGLQGRYCHSDGAPVRMVPTLQALVRRDGVEAVGKMLTEAHYMWSSLSASQEPQWPEAHERDEHEPGYGWFVPHDQVGPEEPWWTHKQAAENPDLEFWYVLNDENVSVLDNRRGGLLHIGDVRYNEDIDVEALKVMECGADFDRCYHVVSYHFPDAPETAHRLGVQTYVGRRERGFNDIVAFRTASGTWVTPTGSGGIGSAREHDWRAVRDAPATTPRYWWSRVKDAGGNSFELRAARVTKAGYGLDLPAKLTATLVAPELEVPKGTILEG